MKYLQLIYLLICKWTLHGPVCYPITLTGHSFVVGEIVDQLHLEVKNVSYSLENFRMELHFQALGK